MSSNNINIINFYPFENKKNAYFVPIIKIINFYLEIIILFLVIFSYLIIYLWGIKIEINNHIYNYQDYFLKDAIPQIASIFVINLLRYRKRFKTPNFLLFKYSFINLIITFILFFYVDIQSFLNLFNINIKELLSNATNNDSNNIHTQLNSNPVFITFLVFHGIIIFCVSLNIVSIIIALCFSPKYKNEFICQLKIKQTQYKLKKHQAIVSIIQNLKEQPDSLPKNQFINLNLNNFNRNKPIQFYKKHKNSKFNQNKSKI